MLILPKPWRNQPPVAVSANTSTGQVTTILSVNGTPINLQGGDKLATVTGSPTRTPSQVGVLAGVASGGSLAFGNTGLISPQTQGYTVVWVGQASVANWYTVARLLDAASGDFNRAIEIRHQWNRSDGTPSRAITLVEVYAGNRFGVESTTGVMGSVPRCIVFVIGPGLPPSIAKVFADGVNVTGSSAGGADFRPSAARGAAIITNGSGAASDGTSLLAAYNRPLTDSEVGAWFSSPASAYRTLLQPRSIWVPVSAGAGGGPTHTLAADGSTFALTGGAATLKVARKLAAAGTTYAVTGGAAALKVGRKLTAAGATYTLSGGAAALKVSRKLAAAGATYALTGGAATFNYSGSGATHTLSAEAATYTFSGGDATLRVARKLVAAGATYSVTYQDATLRRIYTLSAGSASYAFTGGSVALKVARKIVASGASYTMTGGAVTFDYSGDTSTTIPTMPPYITVYAWKRVS